jgi:hypothetical protein
MAVLLLLIPVGLVACRGRARLGVLVVGGMSFALLLIPVATLNYDGRFGVPVHGPLAAAAAIGALGAARRAAGLLARNASKPGSRRVTLPQPLRQRERTQT